MYVKIKIYQLCIRMRRIDDSKVIATSFGFILNYSTINKIIESNAIPSTDTNNNNRLVKFYILLLLEYISIDLYVYSSRIGENIIYKVIDIIKTVPQVKIEIVQNKKEQVIY